ncbi:Oxysterol-binding protein-related protein 8 [Acipenser ruthenus]|uniref:Oxysterol-binding protein n=1 Tax=Acipenser ruthenus TaxID=7906 RepID=A0A662YV06_ACIRT|nr:Oxysterol-binding protein-related protein 8 [Acipenser ruthenus]
MMKEEGMLRRRFSTCAGVTAVFSPRTDGRKLIRNASFGGYNELSPVLSGFDRGKDDVSQPKEDSTLSMSKSKSESKLYNGSDKEVSSTESKLTKKESLKVQKKNYREEKKRATKELLSTITDPSVIVMADWLKIRGTLKSWTKLWCVLKPGVLLIYKTLKNGQWVGTVLLNACELIERPSKKDGFCFKLFHPLEQSIWAVKGPKGETVGSITQPLPSSYLIFRAASESDGRCWLDALELALKCSSLLKRTMIREGKELEVGSSGEHSQVNLYSLLRASNLQGPDSFTFNDSEIETQHFRDHDLYSDKSDRENEQDHEESDNDGLEKSEESDTDTSERQDDSYLEPEPIEVLRETTYLEQSREELGEAGEASQTETVSEENKSLIWTLLKQVRPGMDLSKVVLPTFILEPRSFLDKLSDYYYHADFLSEAAVEENAYNRLKKVVKWYLSGFYKKPQGLKKPYNPILGETFRCLWIHPQTSSKTFYISEQVSHHPPVSAFYVSNRKDGFCLSGSILAKSKFYGRCWLDALELALKCSSLLKRTMIREGKELEVGSSGEHSQVNLYSLLRASNLQGPDSFTFNDSEIETQHFRDHDLYSDKSDRENEQDHEESDNDGLEKSEESDTDTSERQDDSYLEPEPIEVLRETTYLEQSREELGEAGEASQTETVSEENKSLIWTLLKQVRPGMDLSKVVLPTFILEPRSFLDKLSDYYYHADFLSEAAVEENAYNRLKKVVKWYLSGFYKKPQPFLGNNDSVNQISGKIKLGKEVLATLEGHWDSEVIIHDKKTGISDTFWNPTPELRQSRLMRCTVVTEEQEDWESEKLWQHVTQAIHNKDQMEATNEKYILEEAQRKATRERKAKCEEWKCRLFEQDPITGEWQYRYADTRPWDPLNDMVQFEKEGWIQTKVRHRTPMVTVPKRKRKQTDQPESVESGCSSPEPDQRDSLGSERHKIKHSSRLRKKGADLNELQSAIDSIKHTQEEINRSITALRSRALAGQPPPESNFLQQRDYVIIFLLIFVQIFINFLFK